MKRILVLFIAVVLMAANPVQGNPDVYTDNIVILVDCSGSMNGNKITQAKNALKQMLQYIPADSHVGLLAFGSKSGWKYELGPRDDQQLITAINRLTTGGSTPLGKYMKIAADRLLKRKQQQYGYGSYRLLVITDGEASDPRLVESYTPEIMSRGITVDTIGVFMNEQHSLANMVHSYREANDTASLTLALSEVLGEIGSQAATSADSEDVFGEVSSLPDEFVNEVIRSLTTAPETPIEGRNVGFNGKPMSKSTSSATTSSSQSAKSKSSDLKDFVIIGVVMFFFMMNRLSRKRRRGRKGRRRR